MVEQGISIISKFDKDAIIQILSNEIYPRSVKEIRGKLRHTGINVPEYLITRTLRSLLSEGQLRYKAGRWMSNEVYDQTKVIQTGFSPRSIERPKLSKIGEHVLQIKGSDTSGKTTPTENGTSGQVGPWGTFRKLLSYYSECIRNEEGAEASAFVEEIGKKYLYANGVGNWYPKTGEKWSYVIPIGPHVAEFVQNLSRNVDNIIILGYPVEAVHIKRDNEPDTRLIRPIFQYILDKSFTNNSITLSTSDAQPEISLEWMKYGLKSYSEQYHFLSSCGLINQSRPNDEPIGFTSEDIRPDLDELSKTLSTFMSKRVREPLNCRSINAHTLPSGFKNGIYNRAVIMIGNRTKYTQTLLKELAQVGSQTDNILNQTSLKYIFKENHNIEPEDGNEKPHEATVADVLPLNAEQREAISSLLSKNISVVTGPPGTGKSQVVMGSVANARFQDQSVLFASRNHKAIDAVVDRLKDKEGRSLIIRTNSKDDPNLKYTFRNAITDIQATNLDVEVVKSYKQKLLHLNKLLNKRGQHASILDQIYSLRDKIGELEEKLSWLQEDLPKQLYDILQGKYDEIEPNQIKHMQHLINLLSKYTDASSGIRNLTYTYSWLKMILLWSATRNMLITLSQGQLLSRFPPIARKKLATLDIKRLSAIENCISIQQCLMPLVEELKKMPSSSVMIGAIKDLNGKISGISTALLSQNMQSRGGIYSDGDDRQKISFLDSALTTLAQGFVDESKKTEAETYVVKYAPVLLKHFPCWAVTNLSVGSRIPLAPSVFNLVILDEASQCDIASAIPILYRAKRAAVVGDPNQLKHVSKLSSGKDALLRKRSNLTKLEDIRFSYREKSLYDLFAQTNSISSHLLRETYRSCEEIAEYSNQTFYNGVLRVATNDKHLKTPSGTKTGLHWTVVSGPVVSAGRSGCVSENEVGVVFDIIKKILVDNMFRGTVGVVTPFRQQQKRIQDRIFDSDIPYDRLKQANVINDKYFF